MAEPKTKVTTVKPLDYIQSIENESKRQDGLVLLELFARITGHEPKMWGPTMIGYDQYHYKSERSSAEGDWMLTGFSPRSAAISLYLLSDSHDYSDLLAKLGKHKTGRGCLYVNKLADVDMNVLEELIKRSYTDGKKQFS